MALEQDNLEVTTENPYEESSDIVVEGTNPFEAEEGISSRNRKDQTETDAATLKAGAKSNPQAVLSAGMIETSEEFESDLVKKALQRATETARDELVQSIEMSPETAESALQDATAKVDEAKEVFDSSKALAGSVAYVSSLAPAKDLSDTEIQDAAVQHYMRTRIAEIGDQSVLATIADFGGLIFLPDLSYNVAELQERLGYDVSTVNAYINSGDFLVDVSKAIRELPAEDRIFAFETIAQEMQDLTDNEIKQVITLMAVAGQQTESSTLLDQQLDKIDAIDIGLIGASTSAFVGGRVLSSVRRMNNIRSASKAGNMDAAAGIADAATKSEYVSKKVGTPMQDAGIVADPSLTPDMEGIFNGAPQDVQTAIRDRFKRIDLMNQEADDFIVNGVSLNDGERAKAIDRRIEVLEKQQRVQNVQYEDTGTGVNFVFDVLGPDGKKQAVGKSFSSYQVDDVTGTFKEDKVSFVAEGADWARIGSPNFVQGKDRDLLVGGVERVLFASDRIKKFYSASLEEAFKGLKKVEVDNVNKVLLKGDDDGTIYSYDQLVNGVGEVGGIRLTPKEFEAYASTRKLMDDLAQAKDSEVRARKVAMNHKELVLGDELQNARKIDTPASARAAYANREFNDIYIQAPIGRRSSQVVSNLDDIDLDKYYEQGYSLVQATSNNDLIRAANGSYGWSLVKNQNLRELPASVIQKKPGYVPRVWKDAFYFVKTPNVQYVDGADRAVGLKTLRYFDNQADADAYKAQLVKAGDYKEGDLAVLSDRQISTSQFDEDVIDTYGGMYTSPRKAEPVMFGLEGREGTRMDAIESIQGYISHIANRLPMAQYRLGLEKRWMNSAKNWGVKLEKGASFDDALDVVKNFKGINERTRTKLTSSHRQIRHMRSIQTVEESRLSGGVHSLADWMSGTQGLKKIAPYVYRASQSDPLGAIRGSTFNLRLGMYNVSQLLVQGLGASVAMSINPVYAAKGFPKVLAFSSLDQIADPILRNKTIEAMRKFGPEYDDLADAYGAWKRSGMYDSVVSANGELSAYHKALPMQRSMIGRAWEKVVETGQLPFKIGELANMRISFATAYERWRDLNKGKKLDQEAIDSILQRAENYRLNMSRANKAEFQKGLLSIPTQFMQVYTKYIETVLGSQFTTKEKFSLMAGQMAFFGAAGVPFADRMFTWSLEQSGVGPEDVTEEEMIAARRGFIGYLFNDALDTNALVTGRVAIAADLVDNIIDFATEPKDMGQIILGPTATTADGLLNLTQSIMNAAHISVFAEDVGDEGLALLAAEIATNVATLPSSGANLWKARIMAKSQPFFSKGGQPYWLNRPHIRDILMQSFGFSNQDLADSFELLEAQGFGKGNKTAKEEAVGLVLNSYVRRIQIADDDELKKQKAYDFMVHSVLSTFESAQDRKDIMSEVNRRLRSPVGKQDRLIRDTLKNLTSEFTESTVKYNNLLVRALEDKGEG